MEQELLSRNSLRHQKSSSKAGCVVARRLRVSPLALLLLGANRRTGIPTSTRRPIPRLLLRRFPHSHGIRPLSSTCNPSVRRLSPSTHIRRTPHPDPHPSQGLESPHTPQRRMGHPQRRHRSLGDSFRPARATLSHEGLVEIRGNSHPRIEQAGPHPFKCQQRPWEGHLGAVKSHIARPAASRVRPLSLVTQRFFAREASSNSVPSGPQSSNSVPLGVPGGPY